MIFNHWQQEITATEAMTNGAAIAKQKIEGLVYMWKLPTDANLQRKSVLSGSNCSYNAVQKYCKNIGTNDKFCR